MGLRPRQQAFAEYYIETGNQTEAAIKAGYSEKFAGSNASKLLKNTEIKEYIEQRLNEMSERRVANAEEVLETLTRILRREECEAVVVTVKTCKTGLDENGKRVTITTEEPKVVEIPPKLSDVNKAAELLGKRWGLYSDNVKLSGGADIKITVDYGDEEDS